MRDSVEPEWTADEDDILVAMRLEVPICSFPYISRAIRAKLGTVRSSRACVARWHRIEQDDEKLARDAMRSQSLREARKRQRAALPDPYEPRPDWFIMPTPTNPLPLPLVPPSPLPLPLPLSLPAMDPQASVNVFKVPRRIKYRTSWTRYAD